MWSFTMFCLVIVAQVLGDDPHENRIVSGQVAAKGQFPHQASLNLDGRSYCSGSLISKDFVLTAASCTVVINSPLDMTVSVGSTTLLNGIQIPIAEIIVHPEFNNETKDKDAALLRTGISVDFTNNTEPIALPARRRPVSGNVTISGYGSTQIGGPLSNTLMYTNIPVVNITQCQGVNGVMLTENMICVGFENGGSGPCRGDTGGAAVQDGMVIGIVSRPNCGQPTVLTNVASPAIIDFILANTEL